MNDFIISESKTFHITKEVPFFNKILFDLFVKNNCLFLTKFFIFNDVPMNKKHIEFFKSEAQKQFQKNRKLIIKKKSKISRNPGDREIQICQKPECFQIFNFIYKRGSFGKHLHTKKWCKRVKHIEKFGEKGYSISKSRKKMTDLLNISNIYEFSPQFDEIQSENISLDLNFRKMIQFRIQNSKFNKRSNEKKKNFVKGVRKNVQKFKSAVIKIKERHNSYHNGLLSVEYQHFDELVDELISKPLKNSSHLNNLCS